LYEITSDEIRTTEDAEGFAEEHRDIFLCPLCEILGELCG
jgi:hypothetical protein